MPETPWCVIYFEHRQLWPVDGPEVFAKYVQGGSEWLTQPGVLLQF